MNVEDTAAYNENDEGTEADGSSVHSKELNETNNVDNSDGSKKSDGPRNLDRSDANDFGGSSLNTASGTKISDWKDTKDIVNAASDM